MDFNKKWLREKVESLSSTITNLDSKREYVGISRNTVLNLIDQIDELKITEEQALNKLAESYPFSAEGINAILQAQIAGYSPVSTMKFIQPNEPELPVIPQFVADYIESARRENATLLGAMDYFLNTKEIKSWMRVNQELFAKAWISKDGYTIEPEKKYILKNKRGFVSSIQVKQSRNDLTSNIIFNYTPYQQDAYKFSQKEKEFYKDSFYLEEVEVTIK